MSWQFVFSKQSQKKFDRLENNIQSRIKKAVYEKLLINPDFYLVPLTADMSGFYKFRVGDYRLLCAKHDDTFCVVVLKVKHRKEIYRIP